MIIIYLITIIAFYTGYLFFSDIKKALLFFVALFILAYNYKFSIIGINMSINILMILSIPLCLNFAESNDRRDSLVFLPFFFLQCSRLFLIPFQDEVPLSFQLLSWFKHSVFLLTISYLIWSIGRKDPFWSTKLIKVVIFSSFTALLYAIILLLLDGTNPYQDLLNNYTKGAAYMEQMTRYYAANNTGRLFGRISSTFGHPMLWCVVIVILFYIFWLLPQTKSTRSKIYILMVLDFICIITSGVRAGLLALMVGLLFFLFRVGSSRVRIRMAFVLILSIVVLYQSQYIRSYVSSIFESESQVKIKGSSIDMRLVQLEGCFMEISNCAMQGKGYGWVDYYRIETKHGDHPIILCFESLIFSVLCESGYVGVFIWVLYFFIIFWTNRRFKLKDIEVKKLDSLVVSYITYVMATGGSGQDMYVFCILYTSIITYLYQKNRYRKLCRL